MWDARCCAPLDPEMIADAARHDRVVTIEDGIRDGGIGMSIADAVCTLRHATRSVTVLGLPTKFIPHDPKSDGDPGRDSASTPTASSPSFARLSRSWRRSTLRTERLLLRPARAIGRRPRSPLGGATPRSPATRTWIPPYPLDRAEALIAELMAMDGPADDEWWMFTDRRSGRHGGVRGSRREALTWEGRTAEIGYTLAREAWGHGYAVEAAAALVEYLFDDVGVTRVEGIAASRQRGVGDGARARSACCSRDTPARRSGSATRTPTTGCTG